MPGADDVDKYKTCPVCGRKVYQKMMTCPACGGRWNEDGTYTFRPSLAASMGAPDSADETAKPAAQTPASIRFRLRWVFYLVAFDVIAGIVAFILIMMYAN